jgi:hypothetical protein
VTTDLGPTGRRVRVFATLLGLVLVVAGTVVGQDRDFPFAPFRMYAVRDDPNGVVRELRVQVITADGTVHDVTNADGAPRRSELEGRVDDLVARPQVLAELAPLYDAGIDSARTLRLVWRVHALRDGASTGTTEAVIVSVAIP